jgi:hypothetical protein
MTCGVFFFERVIDILLGVNMGFFGVGCEWMKVLGGCIFRVAKDIMGGVVFGCVFSRGSIFRGGL